LCVAVCGNDAVCCDVVWSLCVLHFVAMMQCVDVCCGVLGFVAVCLMVSSCVK